MNQQDANLAGNVHGGTILRMVEEAGFIAARRYLRESSLSGSVTAMLAGVDHVDFRLPMHVGEVSRLEAEVTFVGTRSIETRIEVWAENLSTGETRKTNDCRLYYVAVRPGTFEPVEVPPLALPPAVREARATRYTMQKQRRAVRKPRGQFGKVLIPSWNPT
jgi:acyl-coenzyme A thioesterase 7